MLAYSESYTITTAMSGVRRATLKPGNRIPESGVGNRIPESETRIRNPESTNHRKQFLQICEILFAQLLSVKNKRLWARNVTHGTIGRANPTIINGTSLRASNGRVITMIGVNKKQGFYTRGSDRRYRCRITSNQPSFLTVVFLFWRKTKLGQYRFLPQA